MNPRLILLGGAGVAALAAFYFVSQRGGASEADAGYGMQYPIVFGSGGGSVDPGASGASTDNSIAQMLAGQLSLAQITQQTQLAGYETQKALAQMGYQSEIDLANVDLAKTKATALGQIMTSLFGAGGAGSLNVAAPEISSATNETWDNLTPTGAFHDTGVGAFLPVTTKATGSKSQVSTQGGAGYTQGSIYGTVGFDKDGNIAVDMTRKTASSATPLPGMG